MNNEVLKCINTRRSVRDYTDKKVSDETIKELLQAAVMAPSAKNSQPWNFSIVDNKKKIDYLSKKVNQAWEKKEVEQEYGIKLGQRNSVFFNAPLAIFISGPGDYYWLKDDTNLAVENMFLAAHSLGLGSCWIGYAKALNYYEEIKKELSIPNNYYIAAVLIFGYPREIIKTIPEREPKILSWIK